MQGQGFLKDSMREQPTSAEPESCFLAMSPASENARFSPWLIYTSFPLATKATAYVIGSAKRGAASRVSGPSRRSQRHERGVR